MQIQVTLAPFLRLRDSLALLRAPQHLVLASPALARELGVLLRSWATLSLEDSILHTIHLAVDDSATDRTLLLHPLLIATIAKESAYLKQPISYKIAQLTARPVPKTVAVVGLQGGGKVPVLKRGLIYLGMYLPSQSKEHSLPASKRVLQFQDCLSEVTSLQLTDGIIITRESTFQLQSMLCQYDQHTKFTFTPGTAPSNILRVTACPADKARLGFLDWVFGLDNYKRLGEQLWFRMKLAGFCVLAYPTKHSLQSFLKLFCLRKCLHFYKVNLDLCTDQSQLESVLSATKHMRCLVLLKHADRLQKFTHFTERWLRQYASDTRTVLLDHPVLEGLTELKLQPFSKHQLQLLYSNLFEFKGVTGSAEEVAKFAVSARSLGWREVQQLAQKHSTVKGLQQEKEEKSKNKSITSVGWSDIGGLQQAKQQIIDTIMLPEEHPELFSRQVRPRTGILFYGPPGTGKTLLAKCIAQECGMAFVSVKGPQLLNKYVGQSEKNLRAVFEEAAGKRPCVLFFDEVDSLAPRRGHSSDSQSVTDRLVAQLLTCLDQANMRGGLYVVAATNRPDLLDPSLLKPGRLDKPIYLGLPDQDTAKLILRAQCSKLPLSPDFDWNKAEGAIKVGLSGADIFGAVSAAYQRAMERVVARWEQGVQTELQVTESDVSAQLQQTRCSVTEQQLQMYRRLSLQFK